MRKPRLQKFYPSKFRLNVTSRFLLYVAGLILSLLLLILLFTNGRGIRDRNTANTAFLGDFVENALQSSAIPTGEVAYNIDVEMDRARREKTVEHYGEGMRRLVQDAVDNNADNPDAKPTAENTYQRETALNETLPKTLPEVIGKDFSSETLEHLEND